MNSPIFILDGATILSDLKDGIMHNKQGKESEELKRFKDKITIEKTLGGFSLARFERIVFFLSRRIAVVLLRTT